MRITLLVVENCCWRLCTPLLDLLGCGLCAAGCLCKKTLGTAGGGLVHTVMNELGPDVTRYTINNIQFTVNYWLLQVCCAVGWGTAVSPVPVCCCFPPCFMQSPLTPLCWRVACFVQHMLCSWGCSLFELA